MSFVMLQVDAFVVPDKPFSGNPAAVVFLDRKVPEPWMQGLAMENNLSETAYVRPEDGAFRLRWFTPATEVDLCGHATLATAHALWETGSLSKDHPASFHTRSGELTARRASGRIELDFPAEPAHELPPGDLPSGLAEALGVQIVAAGKNRFDYLIEVPDAASVHAAEPDLRALAKTSARGIMITSRATGNNPGCDFVSRFFAPAEGIDEDPVTGSAHCALAPWWCDRLDKKTLTGYQAFQRGGLIECERRGDRVALRGNARTVFRAELCITPQ